MHESEQDFSIKKLFVPLTTKKAIHIIVILGIIVFCNALFIDFVWDDNSYILSNPGVHVLNIPEFFGSNLFNNSSQYRPLVIVYFSALYNLFGTNQFFYHFFQIAIHIINACLLYILFKSFFDKKLALFLSLVFLVHPMQVESVSYIAASGGVLLFLFGILAVLIVKKDLRSNAIKFLQFTLLLASALVKETGLLFIPLVIYYQAFIKKKNYINDIVFSFIILTIYFFLRFSVGNVSFADRLMIPIAQLSFVNRLVNIPSIVFYYIKTFFYPSTLVINQQWVITSISFTNFYVPLVVDILFFSLLIVFGIFLYKKKQEHFIIYSFFFLWFSIGMILHSQIVPLDATVADRWFYFDMAGLLGLFGIILQYLKFPKYTKLFLFATIIIITLLAARTIIRNNEWRNPINLWTHDIAIDDNYLSQTELSLAYAKEGRLEESLIPARKSVAYFPADLNLYNLGYIYETMGNIQKAKELYTQAYHAKNYLPWQHRHYLALYVRLSSILLYYDDPNDAKEIITVGLQDYPDSHQLWLRMALVEYKLKNNDAALSAAKRSVTLAPNNKMVQYVYQSLLKNQPIDINF